MIWEIDVASRMLLERPMSLVGVGEGRLGGDELEFDFEIGSPLPRSRLCLRIDPGFGPGLLDVSGYVHDCPILKQRPHLGVTRSHLIFRFLQV